MIMELLNDHITHCGLARGCSTSYTWTNKICLTTHLCKNHHLVTTLLLPALCMSLHQIQTSLPITNGCLADPLNAETASLLSSSTLNKPEKWVLPVASMDSFRSTFSMLLTWASAQPPPHWPILFESTFQQKPCAQFLEKKKIALHSISTFPSLSSLQHCEQRQVLFQIINFWSHK